MESEILHPLPPPAYVVELLAMRTELMTARNILIVLNVSIPLCMQCMFLFTFQSQLLLKQLWADIQRINVTLVVFSEFSETYICKIPAYCYVSNKLIGLWQSKTPVHTHELFPALDSVEKYCLICNAVNFTASFHEQLKFYFLISNTTSWSQNGTAILNIRCKHKYVY